MNYRVELDPLAEADLDEAYLYTAKFAPETAAKWIRRFEATIATLRQNPQRCGFANESKRLGLPLRQILFCRRNLRYRAIFLVDVAVVRVIRVRRAAMRFLRRSDLGDNV
jgi:plasmid stabilization system protein ParE